MEEEKGTPTTGKDYVHSINEGVNLSFFPNKIKSIYHVKIGGATFAFRKVELCVHGRRNDKCLTNL